MAVFYKYEYTNKRKNIHPCPSITSRGPSEHNDSLDFSKSRQFGLHWSSCARGGATVLSISISCFQDILLVQLSCPFIHCSCGLLSLTVGSIPRPRAANNFQLVQSRDSVSLLGYRDPHVWHYGLHLAAPFHPAQALLGDGASKKVEDLNYGLQPGPLAHLEQSHLESGWQDLAGFRRGQTWP